MPEGVPLATPPADATRELLLATARVTLDAAAVARVRECVAHITRWEDVIASAVAHRVVPLLARRLAENATDLVPPATLRGLQELRFSIAARALAAGSELARIAGALNAAGVRMLPYKGPLLSLSAYGDAGVRDFVDLDIVVAPSSLQDARAALIALGYRSRHGMGRAQESAIYGGQGHLPFVRDGVPAPRPVELHWRFCAARLPWSPAVGDVLARATTVTFAGRQLFVPSREDQLLLALLHGTRHEWEQLEWVAGVAALISAGDVDVDTVLARAAGIGGLRAALTGLEIARLTLGVRLPSAVEERIRGDANVATVVRTLLPRVACTGQPPVSSAWSRRLALALLERPRDRVRFLACSAFLPTPREWELVKLPAPLAALYFPLRIARLAARIRPRAR